MDISTARLTSLLREAIAPQALPSAKADPVKSALVKALVQPPLPSLRPQSIASALPALLPEPALVARAQQVTSAQIVQAYQALAEPNELADDAGATAAAVRRPTADGDDAQRGPAIPPARVDDGGVVRLTAQPWLALLSPRDSPLRKTSATNATAQQGPAASRSAGGTRPQDRSMNAGLTSLAAGLLVATAIGLVLLVLR
ncbi:hypothetical protein LGH82_08610 [Mesorhizobium sp. PAMC28654]|uniref:hypothetical protein n=1 Tax=Mesorhizobium sp. PAMC28654 TaxID=2880934 RepID=UPI001D09F5B4|nr:hypothetical protein [Mesorhizobium sp. PAMC28654]UDL91302.1 hypothetical protein LGH82_08610 [Mesorhizobium sp. PAMC28654]